MSFIFQLQRFSYRLYFIKYKISHLVLNTVCCKDRFLVENDMQIIHIKLLVTMMMTGSASLTTFCIHL